MRHIPIPGPRTLAFVRLKIACYVLMYIIVAVLLLSFVHDGSRNLVAMLNDGRWRLFFGVYLAMTGISTAAIASWRAQADVAKEEARGSSSVPRYLTEAAWRRASIVAGTVFLIEGAVFAISGAAQMAGWSSQRQVYHTVIARLILLFLFHFPMACGSSARLGTLSRAANGTPPSMETRP